MSGKRGRSIKTFPLFYTELSQSLKNLGKLVKKCVSPLLHTVFPHPLKKLFSCALTKTLVSEMIPGHFPASLLRNRERREHPSFPERSKTSWLVRLLVPFISNRFLHADYFPTFWKEDQKKEKEGLYRKIGSREFRTCKISHLLHFFSEQHCKEISQVISKDQTCGLRTIETVTRGARLKVSKMRLMGRKITERDLCTGKLSQI